MDGSLDQERFVGYLVQDARYLVSFARALATTSARAPDAAAAAFLAESARVALADERQLHAGYLDRVHADADVGVIATSPCGLAYASFLVATASSEPYPVAVASLVPCFAVYHQVGTEIAARVGPSTDHPYRAWIDTYVDAAFAAAVEALWDIAERAAAAAAGGPIRDAMLAAFVRACEYEWMFWDAAWRGEQWPTARWISP